MRALKTVAETRRSPPSVEKRPASLENTIPLKSITERGLKFRSEETCADAGRDIDGRVALKIDDWELF